MRQILFPCLTLVLCATADAQAPPAASRTAPLAATLADTAFMAGHWIGGEPGDLSEEIWSGPEGDSMMGMWRYVSKGKTRIFELLTIAQDGERVVLRLRHFDPRLVGREDKERALELPLVAKSANEAVFEGEEYERKGQVRLTYRRPAPDTLTSVLEKGGAPQTFTFKRR